MYKLWKINLKLLHKDNLLNISLCCKGHLFTHTDTHTLASYIHDTHNDYLLFSTNINTEISHTDYYGPQAIRSQFQLDINCNSSMNKISGYENVTNFTHLGSTLPSFHKKIKVCNIK